MKIQVTEKGIKKIVEIYIKGRNISNSISPYEYDRLKNFISKNIREDGSVEEISNEKLTRALNSLRIEIFKRR